ncbi:phosphopantetheine-binding protein [Paenibacillus tarimensis]|uniref:phosphopantetheine-binding protein n=1 Tax=Paenibacillus tarimensis TaxID=416012 RepID=UPI0038B22FC9
MIKRTLCRVTGRPYDQVDWDESAPLFQHYNMDSFMIIELLLSLESSGVIDITSIVPNYLKSITTLAEYIDEIQTSREMNL